MIRSPKGRVDELAIKLRVKCTGSQKRASLVGNLTCLERSLDIRSDGKRVCGVIAKAAASAEVATFP